jgi:hypothetical protein
MNWRIPDNATKNIRNYLAICFSAFGFRLFALKNIEKGLF